MEKKLDYDAETDMLLASGRINTYMASYLSGLTKAGLNEELWQEALEDAIEASDVGVDNEEEFLTFFYIDHFVEDLAEEIFGVKLESAEEAELKKFMFNMRGKVEFSDLLSFRVSILEWLNSKHKVSKKSYHNRGTPYKALPKYNIDNWYALAERIVKSLKLGFSREFAVREAATTLKSPERYDFLIWYRYHEGQAHQKYDVNQEIKRKNRELEYGMKIATAADDTFYYIPKFKKQEEEVVPNLDPFRPFNDQDAQDFESVRRKLMSRVFAIDKLLERYRKVLSEEQVEGIEDSLNDLRKKVRKLKLATTVKDMMVKTANILRNKYDFADGADMLIAIAQEPGQDDFEEPSSGQLQINSRQDELQSVIEQLYIISNQLKNRRLIRELAEVDLRLHKMGMSSFFPELTDAQSRLIEAFGYASNKVDDVLPKLRGGLALEEVEDDLEADEKGEELAEEVKTLSRNIEMPKAKPQKAPVKREQAPAPRAEPQPREMEMEVPLAQ